MSQKIYEAMIAIMAEAEPILKNRKNQGQGYTFRGIDDVYAALQQVLVKHKVFTLPTVLDQTREERATKSGGTALYSILKIMYRFHAEDGSFVDAIVVGEGMDSGDKASNKAMSVAHKYALIQAFCIPTSEPKDPEHDNHDLEPKGDLKKPGGHEEKSPPPQGGAGKISEAQGKRLFAIFKKSGMPETELRKLIKDIGGVESSKDLHFTKYNEIVHRVENWKPEEIPF